MKKQEFLHGGGFAVRQLDTSRLLEAFLVDTSLVGVHPSNMKGWSAFSPVFEVRMLSAKCS